MQPTHTIRFLSATDKERDALFLRLVSDLFFALGYSKNTTSVSGYDIEVQGSDSIEARQMRARCKNDSATVGLMEVEKFIEAVEYEQKVANISGSIVKYFLSLSGFDAVVWEQQRELAKRGLLLFDAASVIRALEERGVLETDEKANKQAHDCQQQANCNDVVAEASELLIHQVGYIKAVYFEKEGERTHVALIYAVDSTPLRAEFAEQVIKDDEVTKGGLYQLIFLSPTFTAAGLGGLGDQATQAYHRWVAKECGIIKLSGLPLDEQLASKRLDLEKLFVAMRAWLKSDGATATAQGSEPEIAMLGDVMAYNRHLALLATPGGGKSTVLKRLATAYAFRDRLVAVDDKLPSDNLLPLFIRCRDLKEDVSKDILLLLESIPEKVGLSLELRSVFREKMNEALREGQVLLLIDGLDEIADTQQREDFANNVRRFLMRFPQIRLVITSRVEGFRLVAGIIAQVCEEAVLAPFEEADIRTLCEHWHIEVDDDSTEVRQDARTLAEKICKNKSLFTLAQNPLLLTTLLIVKRNIGELPTRRARLYKEAVRVLIKTWNVEGHGSMDEQETLAQLAYVACSMTEQKIKRISRPKLLALLKQAKETLDAELQLVELLPEKFVDTVEFRTSLLMQTGHELVDGFPEPLYEFRHLTFQEYLTAYGYVFDLHEHRGDNVPLNILLGGHFHDDSWKEIIPLAVVLAERKGEDTIKDLIAVLEPLDSYSFTWYGYAVLLGQCLLDEATLSRVTLQAGLQQVARFAAHPEVKEVLLALQQSSRMGARTMEVLEESFAGEIPGWEEYASAVQEVSFTKLLGYDADVAPYEVEQGFAQQVATVIQAAQTDDVKARIGAVLAFASLSWGAYIGKERGVEHLAEQTTPDQAKHLMTQLEVMLHSEHGPSIFAACVALHADATGIQLLASAPISASSVLLLFQTWMKAQPESLLADWIAKTLTVCAPLHRNLLQDTASDNPDNLRFVRKQVNSVTKITGAPAARAAALMGWYWQKPWSDKQLASILGEVHRFTEYTKQLLQPNVVEVERITKMLVELGLEGQRVIAKRAKNYAALDS